MATSRAAAPGSSSQSKLKDPKLIGVACGLLAVVVFAVWRLMPQSVPLPDPLPLTEGRLGELTARVQSWVTSEQRLPGSLDELPRGSGSIVGTADGWGRPFVFTAGTLAGLDATCELRSLGADGQQGTEDDHVSEIQFGDDGYGRIGVVSTKSRMGK